MSDECRCGNPDLHAAFGAEAEVARLDRVIDGDRQYIKRRVAERDAALDGLDRVRALCDRLPERYRDSTDYVLRSHDVRAALDGPGDQPLTAAPIALNDYGTAYVAAVRAVSDNLRGRRERDIGAITQTCPEIPEAQDERGTTDGNRERGPDSPRAQPGPGGSPSRERPDQAGRDRGDGGGVGRVRQAGLEGDPPPVALATGGATAREALDGPSE